MSHFSRRQFVHLSGASLAASCFLPFAPLEPFDGRKMRIQDAIDLIKKACGDPISTTVDTVKSGNTHRKLNGIVTTFLATAEVIEKAIELDANLIITHEPTFYNHLDETGWLEKDPVYEYKRRLLEKNRIVVWRFHDYWHQHRPDGILTGFLKAVGWEGYEDKSRENICVIPPISLRDLASFFKEKMGLHRTFYVGNPELSCTNVGLLPGAWGGRPQINMLSKENIEVIVVGEVAEWETCEYVRDAAYAGMKKGLIVLGHARSEEPGMDWLVEWLRPRIPEEIGVRFVPTDDPFVPV